MEVRSVADEDHRGRVPHRLRAHEGSLRRRRNLPGMDRRRELPSVEHVLSALDDGVPHAVRARIARCIDRCRARRNDCRRRCTRRCTAANRGVLGPLARPAGERDRCVVAHESRPRAARHRRDRSDDARGGLHERRVSRCRRCARFTPRVRGRTARRSVRRGGGHCRQQQRRGGPARPRGAVHEIATVVVSRGELVEIGGGFRVPEIMAETGARLVEVGTTNRTRIGDYTAALSDEVALVLKVHASNYRMVGFVGIGVGRGARDARPPRCRRRRLGPSRRHDALAARTAGVAARRARRAPVRRSRRGSGDLLGRQAARRAAGRSHRRSARRSSIGARPIRSRARYAPTR